jgi:hypothetical protein
MPALVIMCPQCPGIPQGTSVPIERLKELLDSGEPITVIGSQCGHTWKLSDLEMKNLHAAAKAGTLGW